MFNAWKIQDKWSVYYLERGIKTTNEIFDSEMMRVNFCMTN